MKDSRQFDAGNPSVFGVIMRKPQPVVDMKKCRPADCSRTGGCKAAQACPMKILIQEDPQDPPIHLTVCKGCSLCLAACPFKAIRMG